MLAGGDPRTTKAANATLLHKLCQRLCQSIAASTFDGDELNGLGLELQQAIIQRFIPSKTLNLPIIFHEWSETEQKQDDLAAAFSGRVTRLAARSERAGQELSKSSEILTFVEGLRDGFTDFKKDNFSGKRQTFETPLRQPRHWS